LAGGGTERLRGISGGGWRAESRATAPRTHPARARSQERHHHINVAGGSTTNLPVLASSPFKVEPATPSIFSGESAACKETLVDGAGRAQPPRAQRLQRPAPRWWGEDEERNPVLYMAVAEVAGGGRSALRRRGVRGRHGRGSPLALSIIGLPYFQVCLD
jgi:hypothetical protein